MEQKRTGQQRKSFEVFCKELAEALNEQGITQGKFASCFEVDNTQQSVKAVLREAGLMKYLKKSTAEWSIQEIQEIYKEAMRVIAMHPEWGVKYIPFPSQEELYYKQLNK